jgi:Na+-translocating ferredoxin:NAD+ oxidoreductase RnfG subunit
VNNATACRVGGCPVYSRDTHSGNYELFSFFVLYDSNLKLQMMKILEYGPEYGYEITSKRWLRQFKNSKDCNISYGKDVDAISGATISARSLIDNVNDVCEILYEIIIAPHRSTELMPKP